MLSPAVIDVMCAARYHWRMPQCPNCKSNLTGAYCANCGQRDIDLERPIWGLVGDLLRETFEVDGRLAVTLKTLFRHPGKLTSEFLAGRRRAYTSPLRLYLAISITFFVHHLGFSDVAGMFLEAEGSFRYDEQAQQLEDLRVVINTDSVFTNHERRDGHLRSADFLNVEEFPEMIFEGRERKEDE